MNPESRVEHLGVVDAMRIGIDARELSGKPTGVGRYLADLCTEWSHLTTDHRFILYSPARLAEGDERSHLSGLPSLLKAEMFDHRSVEGGSGTWWEQLRLPRVANRDRLDVFFAPAYSAPLAIRAPLVLTIHDMSFATHPEWFHWREGLRRRWLARRSARRADLVVTVSEFARREIIQYLDLPANRVRVVRSGVRLPPHVTAGPGSNRAAANAGELVSDERTGSKSVPLGSHREPLVLFVGSIFNRRHVPDLIEAFARATRAEPHARLAIIGENRSSPRQDLSEVAATAGVADRVSVLSYVTDDTLWALYRRARVFVFLSEYEGFGMTPLEAMAAGIPTVVTDTPVARELYGDAAAFVPPGDLEGTASAIVTLLRDEQARASAQQRAAGLLQQYSWERAARETLDALASAAAHRP